MEGHKQFLKDHLKNGRNASISFYILDVNSSTALCQFNIHATRRRGFQIIRSFTTARHVLETPNTIQAGPRESYSVISRWRQSRMVLASNRQNSRQCIE